MSDEKLLTPKDIAARCQIHPKTVLRAIRAGRLRASQLGERAAYRVREEDFQAWLAATVVTPPTRAGRGRRRCEWSSAPTRGG